MRDLRRRDDAAAVVAAVDVVDVDVVAAVDVDFDGVEFFAFNVDEAVVVVVDVDGVADVSSVDKSSAGNGDGSDK